VSAVIERIPLRIAAFAVGLLAAFGAAFGLGRAVGPLDDQPTPAPASTTTTTHPMDHGEMGS
jgi:hypothetical protein